MIKFITKTELQEKENKRLAAEKAKKDKADAKAKKERMKTVKALIKELNLDASKDWDMEPYFNQLLKNNNGYVFDYYLNENEVFKEYERITGITDYSKITRQSVWSLYYTETTPATDKVIIDRGFFGYKVIPAKPEAIVKHYGPNFVIEVDGIVLDK